MIIPSAEVMQHPSAGAFRSPACADQDRVARERDKLTIAEVCADLGISRRTFYEWRAKGRAPRCITLPNGSLRIRRSEYHRWLASREEAA
jgi:excisionase family DNA binding protein